MSKKENRQEVRLPMAELTPLMESCLAAGQDVVMTVTGNSMAPFLRHRRDQVVLTPVDGAALQPGDVPFYRRDNGRYVLHRVVERREGCCCRGIGGSECPAEEQELCYTMLGDAQTEFEPGIQPRQIIAVAKGFYRRGKLCLCADAAYQRRVLRWHKLLPVRAPLVYLTLLPWRAARWLKRHLNKP